jgi:hypothetical protein
MPITVAVWSVRVASMVTESPTANGGGAPPNAGGIT